MAIAGVRAALLGLALAGCAAASLAQDSVEPRRLSFSSRPIVEALQPTDDHVRVLYPGHRPVFPTVPPGKTVATVVVENNPVIVVARIVDVRPAFLDVWNAFPSYRVVPMMEANYIGSRVTVLLEDVIQTTAESPLEPGGRLTFMYQCEGRAVIEGIRVDTETRWLWPIEADGRYLILGDVTSGSFVPSGMWLEPVFGAPLRGPVRIPAMPDRGMPFDRTDPVFEFDGLSSIIGVTERLREEVQRLNAATSQEQQPAVLILGDSAGVGQTSSPASSAVVHRIGWTVQIPFAEYLGDPALTYRVYGQPRQFEITMLLTNQSPTAVYFHDGRVRQGIDVRVGLLTEGSDAVDPVSVRVELPGLLQGNYNPVATPPDQQLLAEAKHSVWWLIVVSRVDDAPFAPGTYRVEVGLADVRAAVTTFDGEPWRGLTPPERSGVTTGHMDVIVQTPAAPREFADMYRWQGLAAMGRERMQEAAEALSRAVEADPTDVVALNALGNTYMRVGRYRDAVAVLTLRDPLRNLNLD